MLRLIVIALFAAFAALALPAAPAQAEQRSPRFADYPEKNIVRTLVVRLPLTKEVEEDDYKLRRYDAIGETNRANFAGRYFLVVFPCGSTCVSSSIVEAATGKIIDIPFSISGWKNAHPKFQAVAFRHNSRLVVFSGARNEEKSDMGRHYYVLENGELKYLRSEKMGPNFLRAPR